MLQRTSLVISTEAQRSGVEWSDPCVCSCLSFAYPPALLSLANVCSNLGRLALGLCLAFGRFVKKTTARNHLHRSRSMKRAFSIGTTLVAMMLSTWSSGAQTPADREAALSAANAWLKILDTNDVRAAARGWAEERIDMPALSRYPDREAKIQILASILSQQRPFDNKLEFTWTLQPGSVKHVSTCSCGLRDGNYYVMTYDYTSTYIQDPRSHSVGSRRGTDVLYMLQEQDGTWKPAALTWTPTK